MLKKISRLIFVCALTILTVQGSALSQTNNAGTSNDSVATPQSINELTSKLSADEISTLARLLEQLANDKQAVSSMGAKGPGLWETLQTSATAYRKYIWSNVTGLPDMVTGLVKSVTIIFQGRGWSGSLIFIAIFLLALAVAAAGEFAVTWATRGWREQVRNAKTEDITSTIKVLGLRFLLELAGLVVFAILAVELVDVLLDEPKDEFVAARIILLAIVPARLMAVFLRLMLAPNQPSLRLVSADDWTARFVYRNLVILAGIVGTGLFVMGMMDRFDIVGAKPIRFWVGTYVYLSLIYVTWRARKGLTSIIRGEDEYYTPGLERMATWWPYISIAVMVAQYLAVQTAQALGTYEFSPASGIAIISLVVLAPFLDTMFRGVIKHLVPPMIGEGPVAEAAYLKTKQSYARICRILLIAILVVIIFRLWGVSFRNIAAAGVGAKLAANMMGSIFVLVIGYLVWELANLWINRHLAKDQPDTGVQVEGDEGGGGAKSRIATVLPLIRVTLGSAIVTVTILLTLSQLGLNIAPLLAGAGVFGLAIGFGAQTLVKDVVSGVFFLLDDAFRKGEFIDVGGTMGTVEKISVRSLQLRHPNGPVHIIPYGEIPKLTNNSRDYVIMKLRFTVPFDTDIEKVRKLFKKIGQEMMENPQHAKDFIQPFKSQGVSDVDDVGIVVRGKFMTKPGAQWMIRKEIYARVQKAFEENGIHFARKEVRVQIPGLDENEDLSAKKKMEISKAASSAASAVAENESAAKVKKTDDPF
jgi:small-conductance mechanosensitive channel